MGEDLPADLLALAESLFQRAALVMGRALDTAQADEAIDAKAILLMSRDLKSAFDHAMNERARLDKFSKNTFGANGGAPLDFDQARGEIQRRLACLRTAGNDD